MKFSGSDLACTRGERLVFSGLSFGITDSTILVLTGPNGSGKTSLLRVMAGLTPLASGKIGWQDGPVADEPEQHRERLLYVGHSDAIKPALSVRENISQWAQIRSGNPSRIEIALSRWGLNALADAPARFLSAGQRRRLALARLIAVDAPLWLLDEPTIALDAPSRDTLSILLEEHRGGGGMAVIATNVALTMENTESLDIGKFAGATA